MDKVIVLSVCLAILHSTVAQTVDKGNSTEVTVAVVPLVPSGESVDISNTIGGTSTKRLEIPAANEIHLEASHQHDNKVVANVDSNLLETSHTGDAKSKKPNILVNKKEKKATSENATKQARKGRTEKKRAKARKNKQKKSRLAKMRAIILKRRKLQKAKRKAFIESIKAAINNIIEHVNEAHKTCKGTEECNKVLREKLFRLATIKPRAIAALARNSKERRKTAGKRQMRLLKQKRKRTTALTSMKTDPTTTTTLKTTPLPTTTKLTTKKSPKLSKKGLRRRQMLQRMRKRLMEKRMKQRQRGRKPSRGGKKLGGGNSRGSRKSRKDDSTKTAQN